MLKNGNRSYQEASRAIHNNLQKHIESDKFQWSDSDEEAADDTQTADAVRDDMDMDANDILIDSDIDYCYQVPEILRDSDHEEDSADISIHDQPRTSQNSDVKLTVHDSRWR